MHNSNLLKKVISKLKHDPDLKVIASYKVSVLEKSLWQELLAKTRLLYLWYQTCHWQTKGVTFYADHLLFERLYKDTLDEIDQIAERSIATPDGIKVVDLTESLDKIQKYLKEMKETDLIEGSLDLEIRYIALLESIDKDKDISVGARNLLNGIADKHEEHVYLLKQRSTK